MRTSRQILRFCAVGALAGAVDYGTLIALTQVAGVGVEAAGAVGFLASLAVNYPLSMACVYERRDDIGRAREAATFFGLSCVGLAVNECVLWAMSGLLGTGLIGILASKATASVACAAWNLSSRKHWLERR